MRGRRGHERWESSTWERVGLAVLALQAAVVLWRVDLVLVGPDQARDLDVILGIAEGRAFPLLGPMFHAAFKTGPAFYYLAALPVWLGGGVFWMYLSFALLQVAAAAVAWWAVRRFHGARAAAVFLAFGFPAWTVLYMHSGWNPTLVLPLTNLLLAGLLYALHGVRRAWLAVGLVGALLLQVHLSAVPLMATILALALLWRGRSDWGWILGGCAVALSLFIPWFMHEATTGFPYLRAFLEGGTAEGGGFAANLTDGRKWMDLATIWPRFLAGVEQAPGWLEAAGWLAVGGLAVGLLASSPGLVRDPRVRAGWALVVLWLLGAMGFLAFGYVYYLDVLFPWLAWLAALGLERILRRLPEAVGAALALVLALVVLVPAGVLKLAWAREGILTLRLGDVRFPALATADDPLWPFLSEPLVQWYYGALSRLGIAPDRVGGAAALLLREHSNRWHHRRAVRREGIDPERVAVLSGPPFHLRPQGVVLARRGGYRLYDAGRLPPGRRIDFHRPRPDDLPFGTEPSPAWRPGAPTSLPVRCRPGGRFGIAVRCLPRVDGGLPFELESVSGKRLPPRREDFVFMLYQDFGELAYDCPAAPARAVTLRPVAGRSAACDVNVIPALGKAEDAP